MLTKFVWKGYAILWNHILSLSSQQVRSMCRITCFGLDGFCVPNLPVLSSNGIVILSLSDTFLLMVKTVHGIQFSLFLSSCLCMPHYSLDVTSLLLFLDIAISWFCHFLVLPYLGRHAEQSETKKCTISLFLFKKIICFPVRVIWACIMWFVTSICSLYTL